VRDDVVISHRGAAYEIGRGPGFYGIWPSGGDRARPCEWWPPTPSGWSGAWSRFTSLEAPAAIVPVRRDPLVAISPASRAVIATVLLAVGTVFGLGALFPGYFGSTSLASQASLWVPHAINLAAWAAAAVLIMLGGTRLRAGALLAAGTSVIALGMYISDLGSAAASSPSQVGTGLILGLLGWLACAGGSAVALWIRPGGRPAHGYERGSVLRLAVIVLAGLGIAVTFAPSWDGFLLRTAAGATAEVTRGNAFANPGLAIAGSLLVMIALVLTVTLAGLLRPVRQGAFLLIGALIPMAGQAISAAFQIGQPVSPLEFNISPAQAALSGLTITPSLTAWFWAYCAFLVAAALLAARLLIPGRPAMAPVVPPSVPYAGPLAGGFAAPPPGAPPAGAPAAGPPGVPAAAPAAGPGVAPGPEPPAAPPAASGTLG
jgi:hypothetical protein